jgi:hypothetical protein
MDYLAAQAVGHDSFSESPLSTPPASIPGSPLTPFSASADGSPSVRASTRLAARRAQTAIKRSFTDRDTAEQFGKRARVPVRFADEDEDYSNTGVEVSLAGHDTDDTTEMSLESTVVAPSSNPKKLRARSSRSTGSIPVTKVDKAKADRPVPVSNPLVWAKGRGSLCEALPYFRAFQGSLHTSNLIAKGFLIDQETDQRDVFSAQVIISSV